MAWVTIDDQFAEHPKLRSVGVFGLALQTAAICYCSRYLTDGFLSFSATDALIRSVLSPFTRTDGRIWTPALTCGMTGHDADEEDWKVIMVDAGLWEPCNNGYKVHDYLLYNPTKKQVLERRESAKNRMREVRTNTSRSSHEVHRSPSPSSSKKKTTLAHPRAARNGFDTFWAAYPRKKSKGQAERAWVKLQPDQQLQGTILSALERAKTSEWRDREAKYLPHPATWLNAKGWEDEIPTAVPSPTSAMVDCATCGYAHPRERPCET